MTPPTPWTCRTIAISLFALMLLAPLRGSAHALAEVKVLSAIGMRQVMLDMGPKFERATGYKLAIAFDSTGVMAKRVASGEPVDVVLITRPRDCRPVSRRAPEELSVFGSAWHERQGSGGRKSVDRVPPDARRQGCDQSEGDGTHRAVIPAGT